MVGPAAKFIKATDEEQILKEIYIQPDLVKKVTYHKSDNHVNPVIAGAPLDYSFRKVSSLAELEYGTPREFRVGIPKKNKSGKFVSSTLWANYNNLTDLQSVSSLVNVSFHKPEMIAWLDVSFNEIEIVSEELLTLKNLKILYMHGNKIKFFIEVSKLKPLKLLRTLTLHGNPIEEHPNYRNMVIKALPHLINFDFSLITR
ncbi:hypothetical protein RUM43_001269 [Polyplax serrata]|uniref:Leucine-rich repeat-containing protein 51 n=1 Tax=Polyplax serrata TaxID=468196 RepID=A0AAN8XPG5_POLSC